jgi:hypothetical protein
MRTGRRSTPTGILISARTEPGAVVLGLRLFDAATRTFFANDVRRRLDYLVAAPPVFRVAGVRGEPR